MTDASEDCKLHSEKKHSRVAISEAILLQISKLDLDLCCASASLSATKVPQSLHHKNELVSKIPFVISVHSNDR